VEIILGQARRHWSKDEKRSLVAETFVAGQTVNAVARRHNVSRSMLFGWRKQYREAVKCTALPTTATGFTPVTITGPELVTPPASPVPPAETPFIELEFGRNVRLRISGAVDPDVVTAVMKALPRR
jgi:transposase